MPTLLIVEDSLKDMRIATDAAMSVGFKVVQGNTSSNATITRLSRALECSSGLPDVLLVDLDLGGESGFEVLRFRHQTPAVSKLPAVVWTHLDSRNKDLCALFHVTDYVEKGEGPEALREALSKASARVNSENSGE